ncbi:hypothetical protein ACFW88_15525, partial [Streptomyces anandii]
MPAAVAALRDDLAGIVGEMTDRLRAELPSYARVPPDLLTLRVTHAVDRGLGVVSRLYAAGVAGARAGAPRGGRGAPGPGAPPTRGLGVTPAGAQQQQP